MNKYTIIKAIAFIVSIGFIISCNGKGDDDYDWDKVIPGDQKITETDEDSTKLALDTIQGNNYSTNGYRAISRGGSSYNWVSLNYPLTITQREGEPFLVDIKAESRTDTFTWLKVTETTRGGLSGKPDSAKILIIGFCSFSMEELIGNGSFTSKMDNYAPYKTKFSIVAGDTLINENFFSMRWPVKYVLSKDYDQKVSITPGQQFEYNGELVEVKGSGHYNTCKGLMVVNYAVCRVLGGDTLQYGLGIDSLLKN